MKPDILVGLFSIVLSCAYSLSAWNLPDAPIGNPMAPKLFPLVLGASGFFLGLFLLYRGIRQDKDDGKSVVLRGLKLNIAIIAISVTYALIFERIGFMPSTLLFLGILLTMVNGIRGWKINLAVTACFTFGIWYIFERLFYINLP